MDRSVLRTAVFFVLLISCGFHGLLAQSRLSDSTRSGSSDKGYVLSPQEEQDFIREMMEHQRISQAQAEVQLSKYKAILASSPKLPPVKTEAVHKNPVVNASCSNLDFSAGTTANWTCTGDYQVVSIGTDSFGGFPKAAPGGSYSLELGNPYPRLSPYPPAFAINSSAQQTFTVSAADPVILLQFAFVILEFGHAPTDAARVKIEVLDQNNNIIFCSQDSAYDAPGGPPGFLPSTVQGLQNDPFLSPGTYVNPLYPTTYMPWKTANLDLSSYIGTSVTLLVTTSWCRFNYDWAYCYFNAVCSPPNKVVQNDTLCKSNPVPLCAPSGFVTYNWAGPTVSGQTTQCVNTSIPGSYSVTCTNFEGCTYTYDYQLNITLDKITSAFSDALGAVCTGNYNFTNSSSATPVGITNYQWSFGDGATSTTPNPSHNYPPGANTYDVKLVVTSSDGCKDSITKPVTTDAAITPSITPTPATCGNSNGALNASATGGNGVYTYSWNTNQTGALQTGLPADNYTLTVTDGTGCTSSAVGIVNSSGSAGTAAIQPPVNITCAGLTNGSATVNITGGTGTYTYVWSNGVTTMTSQSVSSSNTATGLAAGTWTVSVTDASGCKTTSNASITAPAPILAVPGSTPETCGNNNGSVNVTASGGTGTLNYLWSGLQNTQTVNGLGVGTYSVTVTDANSCTSSVVAAVTGPTKLTLSATGLSAKCNGACDGQAVVIPAGGTSPVLALWSNGGTNLAISGLCSGTFSVTLTDINGCQKDTSFLVPQPTALSENLSSTATNCSQSVGTATVLSTTGGTGTYTYSWSNGATTRTATGLPAGEAVVTITDANGCNSEDSVLVINNIGVVASITGTTPILCFGNCTATATALATGGLGPYNYNWSGGGGTSAVASNLCQGNYTITITDANNCTSMVSTVISQPSAVALSPFLPATICIGQSSLITASATGGTPDYTYTWNPGNIVGNSFTDTLKTTATFTAVATDANGCASMPQSVTITVNPPLSLVAQSPPFVCPGITVNLTSEATGGDGTYSYTWLTKPNQTTQGISVDATVAQTYTVLVNDNCGTPPDTVQVHVGVNPVPVVNFTADKTAGCPLLCVNFTDKSTVTSGTVASWSWGFGNDSTSAVQNASSCFKTGIYSVWLKATSNLGCSAIDTIKNMITVYADPVAAFTTNPLAATVVAPTYYFMDQSTTPIGRIVRWSWTFADPTSDVLDTLENPSHTYPQAVAEYCPMLTVTNTNGCVDTITHCINIGPDFTFFVPNAFTPNGDGINDYFFGEGIGISTYKMLIFDRWGNMIFASYDYSTHWDGRANGGNDLAQQDVYSYVIELEDVFNRQHSYVGSVTLLK